MQLINPSYKQTKIRKFTEYITKGSATRNAKTGAISAINHQIEKKNERTFIHKLLEEMQVREEGITRIQRYKCRRRRITAPNPNSPSCEKLFYEPR